MSPEEIRLACLDRALAIDCSGQRNAIEIARRFTDFVLGTNDAEIIRAIRDLAEKANSSLAGF